MDQMVIAALLIATAFFQWLPNPNPTPISDDEFIAQCDAYYAQTRSDRPATIDDIYIDPSITGPERDLLQGLMVGLPVSTVQDFIYSDQDGNYHSNRPELLN